MLTGCRLPARLADLALLERLENQQPVNRLKQVSGGQPSQPFTDVLHLKGVFALGCEPRRCILCGRSGMLLLG